MDTAVLVAGISASAALAVASLSYFFNKRSEREGQWRKLKLDHYKEYISALSGVVSRRSTAGSQARYADAVNLMTLVAPPVVLACTIRIFGRGWASNAAKSQQRHNETLTTLLREIRRDVHPRPEGRGHGISADERAGYWATRATGVSNCTCCGDFTKSTRTG